MSFEYQFFNAQYLNKSLLVQGCTTATTDAEAEKDFNGQANTNALLKLTGAYVSSAAKQCASCTLNNKTGYLPSVGEIIAWVKNFNIINSIVISKLRKDFDGTVAIDGGSSFCASTQKTDLLNYQVNYTTSSSSYYVIKTVTKTATVRVKPFFPLI